MKAIHVSVQLFLVISCVLLSDEKKIVQGISTTQNVTFIFFSDENHFWSYCSK